MPLTHRISPEAKRQLEHMIAFIYQEASEKIMEIDAKTDEEFNIIKGQLVRQDRVKTMAQYDKKEKNVLLRRQMLTATMANNARLHLLKVRSNLVDGLIYEARDKLYELIQDITQYKSLLSLLIQQGLFKLVEPVVIVRSRKDDIAIVQSVFQEAQAVYEKATGDPVELRIDEKNCLDNSSIGGVIMTNPKITVKLTNTLNARLLDLANKIKPKIRTALFGPNPNRKFADLY